MQTQLEATLAKLISIQSTSSDPAACREILDFARAELEPYGLFFTESKPNTESPWFYATTRQTKMPDILLAAHLDVVPAPKELFTMQKRDGKFYGRGVYDMKVAAACYLEFFKAHAETLRQLDIGILFTTDEEDKGLSMLDVLATDLRPKAVFLPDGGDNWLLEKRAKGLYCIELVARGKAAHGSRPWEGENALHTLLDVIQTLRSKYPSVKPSDSTLTVNKLRAGEAANQLADYASAMLDFRSFSKQDLANYQRLVAEMVRKHHLEFTILAAGAPLSFDTKSPHIQSFLAALRIFTGSDEIHYCESYGASDARYFAEHDIPCIIIEPHGGGRHAADEWMQAEDLVKYYQLIEQWLTPETAIPTVVAQPETAAILN